MTDHLHLINQIAHHDAAIGALSSRMTGVESTLAHVQDKVMGLDSKVSTGFSSLESLVREGKASQGPGLPEMLKGVATGGAIVGMSAAAITMLVTSFVKPELVTLQQATHDLKAREEIRSAAERSEYSAIKDRRRQQIDDVLEKLSEQAGRVPSGWDATLKKGGGL
jgi:hypothetical protein